MTFNQILMYVIAAGIIIGGADKLFGNRFGLGAKFDEGLAAIIPLITGMAGILCLIPLISRYIGAVTSPLCRLAGVDPALVGTLLACDMGGFPLAAELADVPEMGKYFGILGAASIGTAITFHIPVGLGMIRKEDQPLFAKGVLIGIIIAPIGTFIGGLAVGFDPGLLIKNTVPLLLLSLLLALALKLSPTAAVRGCGAFGKGVSAVGLIGLIAAAAEMVSGVRILPGLDPLEESLAVIANLAVILMGSLPILELLCRLIRRPARLIGRRTGLNEVSMTGIIVNMANSVAVFSLLKDMDDRGKVLNVALVITATAMLGDHMAYTAAFCRDMVLPMIIGKTAGGVITILFAAIVLRPGSFNKNSKRSGQIVNSI